MNLVTFTYFNVFHRRVANFGLDSVLREACEEDLEDHCGVTLKEMDEDDTNKVGCRV